MVASCPSPYHGSLPFPQKCVFFPKGWPALYKDSSTQGLKGCNCLKDQLTNSQGNSRRPINWEEEGPGRGQQDFVNWHCLVQCYFFQGNTWRFSLAAWPEGKSAFWSQSHGLWGQMTQPSSLRGRTGRWELGSKPLSSPAHWTAQSHLLVQQFGSTLLMATWQTLFPRTEASKYPGVQVTAVPQPSLNRYVVKLVLP